MLEIACKDDKWECNELVYALQEPPSTIPSVSFFATVLAVSENVFFCFLHLVLQEPWSVFLHMLCNLATDLRDKANLVFFQ